VALARLSEIRIGDLPAGTLVASTATSNGTLSIVLPAVDMDAERARLGKEIARLESQIEVAKARLGNSSFVDRAPAAVIEETRKRLAADEDRRSDMRSQLGKLG
jgi:valyl-tRNA synthetase